MSKTEIDETRIKAMLSFEEEEALAKAKPSDELWVYQNSKGEDVPCIILIRRSPEEIVVQNDNGTRVCLSETQLSRIW